MLAPYDPVTPELLERIAGWYRNVRFLAGTRRQRVPVTCDLPCGEYRPDILVSEGSRPIRMITVETATTLERFAVERWRSFENPYVQHVVYVPKGSMDKAWGLACGEKLDLEVVEYAE